MSQHADASLPFGQVAATYDRIRPGYPDELVDAVVAQAFGSGEPAGSALEVGAGTGIATALFAARGIQVTAVEPDAAMAAVARQRCTGLPVRLELTRFEDVAASGFDLLFSAQAWHWVDPAARLDRAAGVLRPGGTIALFWNDDRIDDPAVQAAVDLAYATIAPINHWETDPVRRDVLPTRWPARELLADDRFTDVSTRVFRWERTLTRADYLTYLGTHSPFLRLDDDTRTRLLAAIGAAAPNDVLLAEDTSLYLARRV